MKALLVLMISISNCLFAEVMNSISENNGLAFLTDRDVNVYSVGISTGGSAEIRMAKALAGRHIVATTIDLEGCSFAQKKIAEEGFSDNIEVKIEDVSKPLAYQDDFFDFIYARLVLHYLTKQELQNALQELHRVLKPNGRLFIVVRSTECHEAKNGEYDPESGMTTYTYKNGQSYSRYFHTQESISQFLSDAQFLVTHVKAYDEQLCVDFKRTQIADYKDNLIEVLAYKKDENFDLIRENVNNLKNRDACADSADELVNLIDEGILIDSSNLSKLIETLKHRDASDDAARVLIAAIQHGSDVSEGHLAALIRTLAHADASNNATAVLLEAIAHGIKFGPKERCILAEVSRVMNAKKNVEKVRKALHERQ